MGKKISLTVLIIVVILAVVAAAGLFIFKGKAIPVYGKVITIPYIEKAPGKVVSGMMKKVETINSAHYLFTIKTSQKYTSPNTNSSGLSILKTPDSEIELNLTSDFTTKEKTGQSQMDLSGRFAQSGTEYSLALKMIILDKKLYLNATQLPVIPMYDLSPYLNKWYYYDLTELENWAKQFTALTNQNTNISVEQLEKFQNIFSQSSFIKVKERLPDEKIEGTDSYHYSIKIDKTGFKDFMKSFYQEFTSSGLMENNNSNINSLISDKALAGFDDNVDKINESLIEIWVGKNDNLIHKFSIIGKYNNNYSSTNLEMSLTLSKINEELKIEEPTGALPLTDVIKALTGQSFSLSNTDTGGIEDLTKDSDNDSLPDYLEELYGTDKNNPDTDGDGYKDGQEVESGYNPKGAGKL